MFGGSEKSVDIFSSACWSTVSFARIPLCSHAICTCARILLIGLCPYTHYLLSYGIMPIYPYVHMPICTCETWGRCCAKLSKTWFGCLLSLLYYTILYLLYYTILAILITLNYLAINVPTCPYANMTTCTYEIWGDPRVNVMPTYPKPGLDAYYTIWYLLYLLIWPSLMPHMFTCSYAHILLIGLCPCKYYLLNYGIIPICPYAQMLICTYAIGGGGK